MTRSRQLLSGCLFGAALQFARFVANVLVVVVMVVVMRSAGIGAGVAAAAIAGAVQWFVVWHVAQPRLERLTTRWFGSRDELQIGDTGGRSFAWRSVDRGWRFILLAQLLFIVVAITITSLRGAGR